MAIHWLDADFFIQAKNGHYPFHRSRDTFWKFLDEQLAAGAILSPKRVYDELTDGTDELAQWVRNRKDRGLRITADKAAQDAYTKVANHVAAQYKQRDYSDFLRGGDGWVIAHAMATGGIVVTQESTRPRKNKVKIPNVCRELTLQCYDTPKLLNALQAPF